MEQTVNTPPQKQRSLPGKYLNFQLNRETYGIDILKVQEIIGLMKITRVPKLPHYVRGVINLRGKIIPVVDLRTKFSLNTQADTEKTCIIVVQIKTKDKGMTVGLIVDEVSEVLDVREEQLEPPPEVGSANDMIIGVGKVEKQVILLLNVDHMLTFAEVTTMASAA